VAILNQTFARFLFGDANPIGQDIHLGSTNEDARIVGVVADSKYNGLREKPQRFLYVPFEQGGDEFTRQAAFFVRTRASERDAMGAIRAAVRHLDRNLPIDHLRSMQEMLDDAIYTERLMATLAIAFGALAALLAAVGLYGAISYSVERRTREFGIRLALGAPPKSLLWAVMREVGPLVAIGVALGLPAGYLLGPLAESQFYGIRGHDLWALAGGTLLIAVVSLVAGLVPAVRAMRVEPVVALRYE
jgi:ABC-type lipoprotein release transport system permease subunit